MGVHVVAVDDQTGEREEVDIPDGQYLLICVRPSHLTHTQTHANGTDILTIKGNAARVSVDNTGEPEATK